ncbi:MAG: hypothetical protein AAF501_09970, partial [Pseudomonadota bacterium]
MQHVNSRTTAWAVKLLSALVLLSAPLSPVSADTSDLVSKTAFRVCADPSNMPFSNKAGEGYENELAELLASKL